MNDQAWLENIVVTVGKPIRKWVHTCPEHGSVYVRVIGSQWSAKRANGTRAVWLVGVTPTGQRHVFQPAAANVLVPPATVAYADNDPQYPLGTDWELNACTVTPGMADQQIAKLAQVLPKLTAEQLVGAYHVVNTVVKDDEAFDVIDGYMRQQGHPRPAPLG